MTESILESVKENLPVSTYCDDYDSSLIQHINTVFSILWELGIGPEEGFSISDSSAIWSDFITDNRLSLVKSYMYLKVELMFDPATNGTVSKIKEGLIDEMESRLIYSNKLESSEV